MCFTPPSSLCSVCFCVCMCHQSLFLTFRKYVMPTCHAYRRSSIVRIGALASAEERWSLGVACRHCGKERDLQRKYAQLVFVRACVCVSPAGPGRLKVMPSPCSASWRAASADGCCCCCCCCCCTVCLAHASLTAGHWLSGTAMPHLLEPANTNTADAPASQCQSRERFGEAGDKRAASRQVFVWAFVFSFLFPIMEKKVSWRRSRGKSDKMEGEEGGGGRLVEKMIGRVKGNEARWDGWWRREGQWLWRRDTLKERDGKKELGKEKKKTSFEISSGTSRLEGNGQGDCIRDHTHTDTHTNILSLFRVL